MQMSEERGVQRNPAERRARARARARVAELQVFYTHLAVYVAVNALLIAIDVIGDGSLDWSYWAAFGWGIGLLAHAAATFRVIPAVGSGWRERKIDELTERELKRERPSRRD